MNMDIIHGKSCIVKECVDLLISSGRNSYSNIIMGVNNNKLCMNVNTNSDTLNFESMQVNFNTNKSRSHLLYDVVFWKIFDAYAKSDSVEIGKEYFRDEHGEWRFLFSIDNLVSRSSVTIEFKLITEEDKEWQKSICPEWKKRTSDINSREIFPEKKIGACV